ncbi:MAG TPA: NAD-dependent epimerase/dehydratase family protein [Mucilaginibacter sp.]|jgi:nucleoside-diphosphate-sugar epimerase|nr:NAD-dependent epimerase/dehydratase family protein [Mucilaginibacter sp.]
MSDVANRILVTGACGQLGAELVAALREKHGWKNVIASDIYPSTDLMQKDGIYIKLDVLNKKKLSYTMSHLGIKQVYHLAAVLSAKGEQNPLPAWELNMQGLVNVLDVAREKKIKRVFWPSSIAVFGPQSFRAACTQNAVLDPMTMYGISKMAGEYWCRYYYERFGVDVRSIRYPGLISHAANPGGGTTDYAVDIFHAAVESGQYECYLKENTGLPMMYMPDAIRATMELMEISADNLTIRTSYNLAAINFTPKELAAEIGKHIPSFKVLYTPDGRQDIADSWPSSIDDRFARHEWGWRPKFKLGDMVSDMLCHLRKEVYA